jgi:hypothetical protein
VHLIEPNGEPRPSLVAIGEPGIIGAARTRTAREKTRRLLQRELEGPSLGQHLKLGHGHKILRLGRAVRPCHLQVLGQALQPPARPR